MLIRSSRAETSMSVLSNHAVVSSRFFISSTLSLIRLRLDPLLFSLPNLVRLLRISHHYLLRRRWRRPLVFKLHQRQCRPLDEATSMAALHACCSCQPPRSLRPLLPLQCRLAIWAPSRVRGPSSTILLTERKLRRAEEHVVLSNPKHADKARTQASFTQ